MGGVARTANRMTPTLHAVRPLSKIAQLVVQPLRRRILYMLPLGAPSPEYFDTLGVVARAATASVGIRLRRDALYQIVFHIKVNANANTFIGHHNHAAATSAGSGTTF